MSRITWRHIVIGAVVVAVGAALGLGVILLTDPLAENARDAEVSTTTVTLPVAPVVVTTPASADDRMNQFLDEHANPPEQHEQMRNTAQEVCRLLGSTGDYNAQVTILEAQANMAPDAAKVFLDSAINIYCPVYGDLVPAH